MPRKEKRNRNRDKRIGRITAVQKPEKQGIILVDVQLTHSGGQLTNVPIGKAGAGVYWTPEKGWMVVVDYLEDGTRYVSDVLSGPEYYTPELGKNALSFQLGPDTTIVARKRNPEDPESVYDIDIACDGKLRLFAGETIEQNSGTLISEKDPEFKTLKEETKADTYGGKLHRNE